MPTEAHFRKLLLNCACLQKFYERTQRPVVDTVAQAYSYAVIRSTRVSFTTNYKSNKIHTAYRLLERTKRLQKRAFLEINTTLLFSILQPPSCSYTTCFFRLLATSAVTKSAWNDNCSWRPWFLLEFSSNLLRSSWSGRVPIEELFFVYYDVSDGEESWSDIKRG